jgi:biopolymer transport protein ExbD
MKFPRNAKIFRGQLDVAPFAGIFFLLCLMLIFSTLMVYSPGVQIELPELSGTAVTGVKPPVISVAVDARGKIHFESQPIEEQEFSQRLKDAVARFVNPPTLIIQGDSKADVEIVLRICHIASQAGVSKTLWGTQTKPFPLSP